MKEGIGRVWNRVRNGEPLTIHGEPAVFVAALLKRSVQVRGPDGSLLLSGRAEDITPEGQVVLVNCKRYAPCEHGGEGLDVHDAGTVKVGVERVGLKI